MGQEQNDETPFDDAAEASDQQGPRANRRRDRRPSVEQPPQQAQQTQQAFQGFQRMSPRQDRDQHPVDRVPEMLRHRREFGTTPLVAKLTNVTLDESTFGVLVRIDEVLRWRGKLNDKEILDRIEEIYVSRFREALS